MVLSSGARLGPYEILAAIGAGGIYVKAANGIGEEQLLFGSAGDKNMECSSVELNWMSRLRQ